MGGKEIVVAATGEEQRPVPVPAGLNARHVAAFRFIESAANGGRYVSKDALTAAIGSDNICGSTQAWVCRLLESHGLISTIKYQRGRQFIITATGATTAAPPCTKPHWRTLPRRAAMPVKPATYHEQRKVLILRVDNRTCERCGSRLVSGCKHYPLGSGA